jgi:hypothetical protein
MTCFFRAMNNSFQQGLARRTWLQLKIRPQPDLELPLLVRGRQGLLMRAGLIRTDKQHVGSNRQNHLSMSLLVRNDWHPPEVSAAAMPPHQNSLLNQGIQ